MVRAHCAESFSYSILCADIAYTLNCRTFLSKSHLWSFFSKKEGNLNARVLKLATNTTHFPANLSCKPLQTATTIFQNKAHFRNTYQFHFRKCKVLGHLKARLKSLFCSSHLTEHILQFSRSFLADIQDRSEKRYPVSLTRTSDKVIFAMP